MTMNPSAATVPEWTVGDRLRKARELTGLTQAQFAEQLGVTRNTIGAAESGGVAVRRITINAYAMATGISAEWLENGTAPGVPTPPDDGQRSERQRRLEALAASKRGHAAHTDGYRQAA